MKELEEALEGHAIKEKVPNSSWGYVKVLGMLVNVAYG